MSRFLAKCQCSWTKCSLVARTDQCRVQSSLISFHIPHFPFVYHYTPPCRATFVLLVSPTERGVDAGCRNSQSLHISGFLHVVLLGIGRIVRVCGLLLEKLLQRTDHAWTSARRRVSQLRGEHDHRQDQVPRLPGQLVSAQTLPL